MEAQAPGRNVASVARETAITGILQVQGISQSGYIGQHITELTVDWPMMQTKKKLGYILLKII